MTGRWAWRTILATVLMVSSACSPTPVADKVINETGKAINGPPGERDAVSACAGLRDYNTISSGPLTPATQEQALSILRNGAAAAKSAAEADNRYAELDSGYRAWLTGIDAGNARSADTGGHRVADECNRFFVKPTK